MDLKVLKAFLTVCKTGNITKAAEEIYLSQPALSRQIQDLEEELGCKLFESPYSKSFSYGKRLFVLVKSPRDS